jgi:hypothetical protein
VLIVPDAYAIMTFVVGTLLCVVAISLYSDVPFLTHSLLYALLVRKVLSLCIASVCVFISVGCANPLLCRACA